jgi:SAM-dependent methyltransferase
MDSYTINKTAWSHAVADGTNPYTHVVTPAQVAAAHQGRWSVYVSDCTPLPTDWFPPLDGLPVLCLASGGGQQGPILAAVGADVTVLDASPQQLVQDRFVATRDGLDIRLVEGDMADLSAFDDASFALIVNPPSTMFVPDVAPVWRACYRVLQPGGVLITGFMNPDEFVFDADALDNEGVFVVKHALPYVEAATLDPDTLAERLRTHAMFHYSHTLEAHLGGLTAAGFVVTGFYEDRRPEADGNPIRHVMPSYYVVRAQKRPVSEQP